MTTHSGLLLRGIRWRLGASLLTVLTSAIAVAAAVLGPLYLHTAGDSVLRRTIDSAAVQSSGVSLLPSADLANQLGALQEAERTVQAAGGAHPWYGPPITTVTSGVVLSSGKSQLFARTGICRVLHFVQGGCDLGPGDIVMTARGARQQGVRVGEKVRASITGVVKPLRLKVTGIVAVPDAGLPYWWGDGPEDFPLGQSSSKPPETDPLITSQTTALDVPQQDVPTATGQVPLRSHSVDSGDEAAVKAVLSRTIVQLGGEGIQVSTQLPALMNGADHERGAMSTIVTIAATQLVLLATWVLASLLVRGSDARRAEARVARLRGFPPISMLWATAAEPGLLCLLGVVLGVAVAWAAIVLARSQLFLRSAAIAFDGWAYAALALTLVAIIGVLGMGTVRLMRGADPTQGPRTAPGSPPTWSRVADAVLVVLALVGLLALGTTGALNGRSDPLASAAPALIALGTAVLAVQGVLLGCRFGISLTADTGWVGSFLALRQSVRRPQLLRQARVLIIALCLACFATAAWSVARTNRSTAAGFQVGATSVVSVAARSAASLERGVDQADPAARFAMAAIDLHTPSTTLLAVDARRLAATASWPQGTSARTLGYVARALDPPSPPAVSLPDAPVQVAASTVASTAGSDLDLAMWVFDSSGGTAIIDMGTLLDGPHSYRGDLTGVCPGGCRLSGFGVIPATGHRPPSAGVVRVTISRVSHRQPDGSAQTVPADLISHGWRSAASGVQVQAVAAHVTLTIPAGTIAADAGAQGAFTAPMASPADHPRLLPVVAASQLAEPAASQHAPLTTEGLDGDSVDIQRVVTASALPRVGSNALMVDLALLAHTQVGPMSTSTTDEVWLGSSAPPDALARLRAAGLEPIGVERSSTVFASLQRSGPAFADDFLLAATIAALLVAAASTLGTLGGFTRERATELVSLEVAGVPRPALIRSLGLESAILILTALSGVAAGALSAVLAVPSLPELTFTSFAPLQHGLPTLTIATVTLAVVVIVATSTAAIAVVLVRRMSPSLLRMVPDDNAV